MRKAFKVSKSIQAYYLGDQSKMEQLQIAEGIIRVTPNGYELMSLEAIKGHGEVAKHGYYFKVDTADEKYYAYPNEKSWFESHHRHLEGDTYIQVNKPLFLAGRRIL